MSPSLSPLLREKFDNFIGISLYFGFEQPWIQRPMVRHEFFFAPSFRHYFDKPRIRSPGFVADFDDFAADSLFAQQTHHRCKVVCQVVLPPVKPVGQLDEPLIAEPFIARLVAHQAPVAFLHPGIVVLFVGPGTSDFAGLVVRFEKTLQVMVYKLRTVIRIDAPDAERQLAQTVFGGVASRVLSLVPNGAGQ